MDKINVIIVDDHVLFREGVELILKNLDFIDTISHASNGIEFLEIIEKQIIDVALMDINMPEMDGITATQKAKKKYPEMKMIALSMQENIHYYLKMTEAGADGFITKDTDSYELQMALSKVMFYNEKYFSQKLLQKLFVDKQNKKNNALGNSFSKRELDVLVNICKGLSSKEIAEQLFISPRTVERHKENLLSKTNSKNTISLVIKSIQENIISLNDIKFES